MRSFIVVVIAGCSGGSHHGAPDAALDHLSIRSSCAFPLGSDGAIVFPDTGASAQTSYRPVDLVNGDQLVIGRENIQYAFEGPDAADFVVTTHLGETDSESCGLHEMDTVEFQPGDFCRLDVEFQPTALGDKQATLHVTFRDIIDETFDVRGTAVAAPTGVYADFVDLYVKPTEPAMGQGFRIVNAGTTDVDLGDPVVTGPFTLQPPPGWTCPTPLPAGEGCLVNSFAVAAATGCPAGSFSTTTDAVTVPLSGRVGS